MEICLYMSEMAWFEAHTSHYGLGPKWQGSKLTHLITVLVLSHTDAKMYFLLQPEARRFMSTIVGFQPHAHISHCAIGTLHLILTVDCN